MATVPGTLTFAAGSVLTAAQLNTYLTAAVQFLINRPTCQCRQTTTQSIAASTGTAILLDAEDIDNDNMHSTTTNTSRFTTVTAGRYEVSGRISWVANASGERESNIFFNGGLVHSATVGAMSAVLRVPTVTVTIFLNVGDYIELVGYQTAGTLGTSVAAYEQPFLCARWVGTT